jgi:hypothetical protein
MHQITYQEQQAKGVDVSTRRACLARLSRSAGLVALTGVDQVWASAEQSMGQSYIVRDLPRIGGVPDVVKPRVHGTVKHQLAERRERNPVELVQNINGGSSKAIPAGYVAMGDKNSVPAWFLYGIAMQESNMLFGRRALPYPWTLNVKGQGKRYKSYDEALSALRGYVSSGLKSVDIGCMQVNWRWHGDRLQTLERALDPYSNIDAGAQILRVEFVATGDWFKAAMRYHAGAITPDNHQRATRYATDVFKRLDRMGIRHA